VSLNQADFGKKGPTEKCRKVLKPGKKQAKRRNGWKGQFPFLGKRGKGNCKNEKAQAKKCSREKA
jgi:hypothetical protein